jgi:hypothetical protein
MQLEIGLIYTLDGVNYRCLSKFRDGVPGGVFQRLNADGSDYVVHQVTPDGTPIRVKDNGHRIFCKRISELKQQPCNQ